jgi:hypothetical protein
MHELPEMPRLNAMQDARGALRCTNGGVELGADVL